MKIYRPTAIITCPGYKTETYFAPFATLFPSFKCAWNKEQEFIGQAKVMYEVNTIDENDINHSDIAVDISYRVLQFHPLRDIWNRIRVLFGLGF